MSEARGDVLVVNGGSSSIKLAVVDPASGTRRMSAVAQGIGSSDVTVTITRDGSDDTSTPIGTGAREVLEHVLDRVRAEDVDAVVGVGHRVVHGGPHHADSVLIDDGVVTGLRSLVDLAPLQMTANLLGIEVTRERLPDLPQVAAFDTGFHHEMPEVAHRYAVPQEWYADHAVRRYGFHGISCRFVSARAAELLGRPVSELRLVVLHLGNGCSATAVSGGRSIDTTMGLTPLEGLVMGTRSGDVDPGLVGYVSRLTGADVDGVLDALNHRSGLLGLSGISNDVRRITEAAEAGSRPAETALRVFSYRAAKAVGALAVALDGIDAVVLTGGIGERDPGVRARILSHLSVLGLDEDPAANAANGAHTDGRVSRAGDPVVLVVPTDEELVIARDTAALVVRPTRT